MNVEKLTALADVIEKGYLTAGDKTVAFTMSTVFYDFTWQKSDYYKRENVFSMREDIPDEVKASAGYCGCIMGITILMWGNSDFLENLVSAEETGSSHLPIVCNIDIEARHILGLESDVAHDLFYGMVSRNVTGPQTASVIRKLLATGTVDWWQVRQEM